MCYHDEELNDLAKTGAYKYCRCLISGRVTGVEVDWHLEEIEYHAQTDTYTQNRGKHKEGGEGAARP